MLGKNIMGIMALTLTINMTHVYAFELEMENIEVHSDLLIEEKSLTNTMSAGVLPYDPINHQLYEKVLLGKVQRNRNPLRSYDYWRYVTVYNVETIEERIAYLPYFEEACHDNSFFMAEWGESRTIKVTLSSEVKAGELGLSASIGMSIEQGTTFSTSRRIKAESGIRARHYPYKVSDVHEGVTYIQTYNSSKRTYGYLKPSLMDNFTKSYPYEFYLDNQNIGLKVKREVLERCEGYNEDSKDDPLTIFKQAGSVLK